MALIDPSPLHPEEDQGEKAGNWVLSQASRTAEQPFQLMNQNQTPSRIAKANAAKAEASLDK